MNDKAEADAIFWEEEINGLPYTPIGVKRKARSKKKEYIGWGSTSLIRFLESIGKDTSKQISQYDLTSIVNEYVKENRLIHPTKKKRIICDERLHLLFGRKTISRIKIHELLQSHFAENHDESSDDSLFNFEDDENSLKTYESQKATSERKTNQEKKIVEKPKSCFAAISPSNIKLVYLKKSLVEELLKNPKTFESKVVGSFIRIRSDPNDYLQKNSHQLLQVTGISKMNDVNGETLLQVSGFFKDIRVRMLSDENFSEEECDDLHQRVKDGLVPRLTIVDLEQKVKVLHEDMTKHYIARELALLQNLIDRANEKGWRREYPFPYLGALVCQKMEQSFLDSLIDRHTLCEYLEKREKLQTEDEQQRLLREIPEVIAEDLESESTIQELSAEVHEPIADHVNQGGNSPTSILAGASEVLPEVFADHVKQEGNSPKSILAGASEGPLGHMPTHVASLNCSSPGKYYADHWYQVPAQDQSEIMISFTNNNNVAYGESRPNEAKTSQGTCSLNMQVLSSSQVIELSDDEENQAPSELSECSLWHYLDPQGDVQGPFPITSLKHWSDARYFPPDFKVWKAGQSQDESVLLVSVLQQYFPR
ncbi:hypothetical protein L6164_006239 [Bauhinia variegata]|uniref:Uncharacterized protein n=1 Tax=Bauhinia variegata TaxID=167791 RepID=A0ACB9PTV6_BAUVA|nr:hypothetical protein L6164_006239 [Bauhinia variegata]